RKKKYCILNKQYSKEDYKKLRETIIASMNEKPYTDKKGREYRYAEFFPAELSPFGYNETGAQEEFPLDEPHAQEEGYQWVDKEKFRGQYTITKKANELSDTISEVSDSILNDIIECKKCTLPYRIIQQELAFYRKQNLPLPRLCIECRYKERIAWKNPFRLFHRSCQCAGIKSDNGVYQNTIEHSHKTKHCPNEFETTYAPENPAIIYCERCYLLEVM
ncbi:MAG: hypothetical protein HY001_04465, partial [Candidatus Portnoybacteria bacterium]|nr:hypothetical protein [Candidatus Portnoybacteria bacterium]